MARMKQDLDTAASKIIHAGATSKYTSINTKDGYIEFRSPGGDWLNANMDQLETTLLRFVVGMDIALDENKHKQEYVKKFYKMIAPSDDSTNTLQYFAKYSAGELPKSALASFLRQAQLQRKVKREKGGRYWWSVKYNNQRIEVVASTEDEAKSTAIKEWGIENPEVFDRMTATALRPYDNNANNWEVYDANTGKTVGQFKSVDPNGSNREAAGTEWRQWRFDNGITPSSPDNLSFRPRFDQNRYELFNLDRNRRLDEPVPVNVTSDEQALTFLDDYINHGPHGLQPSQAKRMIGIRRWGDQIAEPILANPIRATSGEPQPAGSVGQSPSSLTPRGPGPWEVYRISDGTSVAELGHTNRAAAETEAGAVIGLRREAPELYGVRTRASTPRPIPGVTDIEPDIRPGSTQDLQRQRATPGTFTGAWQIIDNDGNEMHRFSGVGNNQRDANRVATQWVQNNGYAYGTEIEVVPIMS
jgi:hypothetical protein